jgi:hypothetical protein
MKPSPSVEATRSFRPGPMRHERDDVGLVRQVDHEAHGLAHAAPAGKVRGRERVEAAVVAEEQDLVGRLGVEGEAGAVAVLELELAVEGEVALHRADPAHLRADDGDGLALDHRLERHLGHLGGFGELREAGAARVVLAEGLLRLADLVGDARPLEARPPRRSSSSARSSVSASNSRRSSISSSRRRTAAAC